MAGQAWATWLAVTGVTALGVLSFCAGRSPFVAMAGPEETRDKQASRFAVVPSAAAAGQLSVPPMPPQHARGRPALLAASLGQGLGASQCRIHPLPSRQKHVAFAWVMFRQTPGAASGRSSIPCARARHVGLFGAAAAAPTTPATPGASLISGGWSCVGDGWLQTVCPAHDVAMPHGLPGENTVCRHLCAFLWVEGYRRSFPAPGVRNASACACGSWMQRVEWPVVLRVRPAPQTSPVPPSTSRAAPCFGSACHGRAGAHAAQSAAQQTPSEGSLCRPAPGPDVLSGCGAGQGIGRNG